MDAQINLAVLARAHPKSPPSSRWPWKPSELVLLCIPPILLIKKAHPVLGKRFAWFSCSYIFFCGGGGCFNGKCVFHIWSIHFSKKGENVGPNNDALKLDKRGIIDFFSPRLTWRDMQHLIVRTSNNKPLMANSGWTKNAVGHLYNPYFGFGLMNAARLVWLARKWKTVPKSVKCTANLKLTR